MQIVAATFTFMAIFVTKADPNNFFYIWVKMPRKNNGLIDVLNLLFLAAYCGQL